jgi:hypothetical protein
MKTYIAFGLYRKNELGGHQEAIGPGDPKAGVAKDVYLASDVDGRIAALEKALRLCLSAHDSPDVLWIEAVEAANKALMERSSHD